METRKQTFLQLSIKQLEILETAMDYAIVCGCIYDGSKMKRKAEYVHNRLLKEIENLRNGVDVKIKDYVKKEYLRNMAELDQN